ncbi:MAG: hypothetical protein IPJ65_38565 [Archangiaceae bacterium]|nr:hypothetical protein [Archangiaceae bacterium]
MLSAVPALADDAKVAVQVEVVLASLTGNTIDPPTLKAMQDAMAKKVKYGSLKRQSLEKLELQAAPRALKLPNGVEAQLSLDALKDDVATLKVKVPPADAKYTLGKKGSLYVQAGKLGADDLWLVVSPVK